ncbi:toprim domain-containing protein [Kribbella sp. NBC_01484]|uniref:toprim domain-containing protein n=1 Tax=Kribbella sp. NBC_01484 TaxID=2903579 RepID=UPI002E2F26AA|nr:toprim domain-containing protein [Kribbella sp. NBC_01484]
MREAHAAAGEFFRNELLGSNTGWAPGYLTDRGLGHVLRRSSPWKVGYAPDGWAHLVDHLRLQGFEDEDLVDAGLASVTKSGYLVDRFRDRIMFPAWDCDRQVVGFVGRSRSGRAKYLNSSTTPIYQKSHTLVGLVEQRDLLETGATPVLVEGPMDAVAIDELSRLTSRGWAGLAVCGTALSFHQATMVRLSSSGETVIVAADADRGGRHAAVRWLDDLSSLFKQVLIAELPVGNDPASLLETPSGADRLFGALSTSRPLAELAIEVEIARWSRVLDHISGRVNALRRVAPLVARLPHDRVAGQLGELSKVLDLDQEIVSREFVAALGRSARRTAPDHSFESVTGVDPPEPGPTL